MNTLRTLACIAGVVTLSGCAEMGQLLRESSEFQAQQPPSRSYFTDPIVAPVLQTTQPSWGVPAAGQYQSIMVNTPQGAVWKQCKVYNGKIVTCL